jgi:serine/threonine protein kinase
MPIKTGNAPFEAKSPMEVLMKHLNDPVPDTTINTKTLALIRKMMEKEPDKRYKDCQSLLKALYQLKNKPSDEEIQASPVEEKANSEDTPVVFHTSAETTLNVVSGQLIAIIILGLLALILTFLVVV